MEWAIFARFGCEKAAENGIESRENRQTKHAGSGRRSVLKEQKKLWREDFFGKSLAQLKKKQ